MTTVSYAVAGALLAFAFALIMIFKVMPQADHIVKKNYGPTEACITTRFCFMCIALPFYVFTIWMAVVVTFDEDHGVQVIDELCGDFTCTRSMALGRAQFDKHACMSPECSYDDVKARQGSQPLGFDNLGLGDPLDFTRERKSYTCVDEACTTIKTSDGEECACPSGLVFDCVASCESSLEDFNVALECDGESGDDGCDSFLASFDSDKEFGLFSCNQTSTDMECDVLISPYFYPNVFFAGAMVILFIFPVLLATYVTLKTQLKKIFKCNDMTIYVYSQEAGIQSETRAENLNAGGYTNAESLKHKGRTCGKKDVFMLTVGPALIIFFSWMVIIAAGRVGAWFIALAFAMLFLHQVYTFRKFKENQRARLEERVERNNANSAYY